MIRAVPMARLIQRSQRRSLVSSTATPTVGNYVITPAVGTLSATNYDFTPFVNGTLHITKVHLTVTADDKSRAYGAANPTFTATITGFVNGDTHGRQLCDNAGGGDAERDQLRLHPLRQWDAAHHQGASDGDG